MPVSGFVILLLAIALPMMHGAPPLPTFEHPIGLVAGSLVVGGGGLCCLTLLRYLLLSFFNPRR